MSVMWPHDSLKHHVVGWVCVRQSVCVVGTSQLLGTTHKEAAVGVCACVLVCVCV